MFTNLFTNEQMKGFARWILALVGGIVAGWAAKTGWITSDQVMAFFNSETAIGLVVSGIALVWSMIVKTDKGVVASAAALPGTTVVTTPEIAAAVPSKDALSSASVKVVAK
jgi:hypothetical protein